MDLKGILAISGHSGLFKHISKTRNGIIVESLTTKKRMHAFTSARISALQDIAIYTDGEDKALLDIFQEIYKKEDGKASINPKSSGNELKKYMEGILPEYDKERVYTSDIKRVISWYNTLNELNIINLEAPIEEEADKTGNEKEAETSEKEAEKKAN